MSKCQSGNQPWFAPGDQVIRLLESGGFLAKYLRIPVSTASAILSW
jgi:hypothetical protein